MIDWFLKDMGKRVESDSGWLEEGWERRKIQQLEWVKREDIGGKPVMTGIRGDCRKIRHNRILRRSGGSRGEDGKAGRRENERTGRRGC